MGSYDYTANSVVNFSMINCRMNHILDRTRWGVIATNYCKNILVEDCRLTRMDAHMGVSGTYVIRRTTLGYMGLNAIGRGLIKVEDSTLHGSSFISFRGDYGSTWEGDVEIRNSRWIPQVEGDSDLVMFNTRNDGQHDFGYPCFMPERVSIDGLHIDDSGHDGGLHYFGSAGDDDPSQAPFPYALTEKLTVRNIETASGRKPGLSTNAYLRKSISFVENAE
jgi:hypothetical protein